MGHKIFVMTEKVKTVRGRYFLLLDFLILRTPQPKVKILKKDQKIVCILIFGFHRRFSKAKRNQFYFLFMAVVSLVGMQIG